MHKQKHLPENVFRKGGERQTEHKDAVLFFSAVIHSLDFMSNEWRVITAFCYRFFFFILKSVHLDYNI